MAAMCEGLCLDQPVCELFVLCDPYEGGGEPGEFALFDKFGESLGLGRQSEALRALQRDVVEARAQPQPHGLRLTAEDLGADRADPGELLQDLPALARVAPACGSLRRSPS